MSILVRMKNLQMIVLASMLMTSSCQWSCDNSAINVESMNCSNDSTCPTWFMCNSDKKCTCDKGKTDAVICDNEKMVSAMLDCHCVTYDAQSRSTFAGSCFYNCEDSNPAAQHDIFQKLPRKREKLINKSACTKFHRTGLLCGDCEEGYSPFVLSYNLSCVECPDGHKNWWKFILAGFVPLTFFYIFIVIFKINVTSSHLHGAVLYSQITSMSAFVRVSLVVLSVDYPISLQAAKAVMVFYSFWNLNLFRSVIPDICLNVSTLQALTLDYLTALYPFALIITTYFIINLYDKKHNFIATVWKPFHKILTIFDKSLNIRTSVFDAFTTLFLLSYVKIVSVSADLLIPTQIYKLGSNSSTLGLYYSPSISYFGPVHLPYAILAIIILTLFICVPTVIFILYPFQFFQKFLSLIRLNWHFLHAFVDSFQGCYKDGTEPGTLDCRWFSAIMLLFYLFLFVLYGLTLSIMFFVYAAILVAILLIAIINVQPYKMIASFFTSTDLMFLFLLTFLYVSINGRGLAYSENYSIVYHTIFTGFSLLSALVPLFYIIFLILKWFVARVSVKKKLTFKGI